MLITKIILDKLRGAQITVEIGKRYELKRTFVFKLSLPCPAILN